MEGWGEKATWKLSQGQFKYTRGVVKVLVDSLVPPQGRGSRFWQAQGEAVLPLLGEGVKVLAGCLASPQGRSQVWWAQGWPSKDGGPDQELHY